MMMRSLIIVMQNSELFVIIIRLIYLRECVSHNMSGFVVFSKKLKQERRMYD
jgi:hypothetical protein